MMINNNTQINGFIVGEKVWHKYYGECKIKEFYYPTRDRVRVTIKTTELCGYSTNVNIDDLEKI